MESLLPEVLLLLAEVFLSKEELIALSSTSKYMATVLRPGLFRTHKIVHQNDYLPGTSLLTLVRENSAVCGYIRHLVISVEAPNPPPCIEIMNALSAVQTLHLAIPWSAISADSIALEDALVRLVASPAIQDLTISETGGIPIVKITNAFASHVQPIHSMSFRNCAFTLLELQAHILDSITPPPLSRNPFDKHIQKRWLEYDQKRIEAATLRAPEYTGKRWLPTHLTASGLNESWNDMANFIDTSKVKTLTIYWKESSVLWNFDAWAFPKLDQLRLQLGGFGALTPFTKSNAPRCHRLFVTLALDSQDAMKMFVNELPAFLSAAVDIEQIDVKIIASSLRIEQLVTENGNDIRTIINSVNADTEVFTFGLSISCVKNPESKQVWCLLPTDDYTTWFEDIHEEMQTFLPTGTKGVFRTGLFWEVSREMTWDFMPALGAEGRSIKPKWL